MTCDRVVKVLEGPWCQGDDEPSKLLRNLKNFDFDAIHDNSVNIEWPRQRQSRDGS